MPLTAAASARGILTGLHDVMASRGSAQSKLDKVVDLIAGAMRRSGPLSLIADTGRRRGAALPGSNRTALYREASN